MFVRLTSELSVISEVLGFKIINLLASIYKCIDVSLHLDHHQINMAFIP